MNRLGVFLGVVPGAGGMFQYAQSILDALLGLPKDAFSVTVAYVDPIWKEYLARYGFGCVCVPYGKWGLMMADAMMAACIPGPVCRRVARLVNPVVRGLAELHCDLWLFPAQDALSYQVLSPVLVAIHDLMHRYEPRFPEVSAWGRYAIRERRFRGIVQWAEGMLVDSETGRRQLVESYGADPMRIYPLPYIAPRYTREHVVVPDFDRRYRLPSKFLFYPAQFWEHKNHIHLLSALSMLRAECPDVHLVLCGAKKSGFEAVRRHVISLGLSASVTFTGYVPEVDIAEIYRCARAMIMPTYFGPTNIPPLEAFALGCPAAVSDIYGMREQTAGAALLFDPSSVEEMAVCMRRLWQDDALCADLRQRGLRRAAEWGERQFNNSFENVLSKVLGRIVN